MVLVVNTSESYVGSKVKQAFVLSSTVPESLHSVSGGRRSKLFETFVMVLAAASYNWQTDLWATLEEFDYSKKRMSALASNICHK